MVRNIALTESVAETLRLIEDRARSLGVPFDRYLKELAEEGMARSMPVKPANLAADDDDAKQWIRRFRDWAASHPPVNHFVDDSRESIYPDRV